MKIKLELFGATRDLNSKEFIEFNIEEKSSIKELRKKIINYVDDKFKGNENLKKIIETSAFCTEDNNIVSDNYKIIKDQKIGIIPPIGGG
tara:strand:+ start:669 stop:938 length:270 start_codon:yes stop_codon:yes gene_type:complete